MTAPTAGRWQGVGGLLDAAAWENMRRMVLLARAIKGTVSPDAEIAFTKKTIVDEFVKRHGGGTVSGESINRAAGDIIFEHLVGIEVFVPTDLEAAARGLKRTLWRLTSDETLLAAVVPPLPPVTTPGPGVSALGRKLVNAAQNTRRGSLFTLDELLTAIGMGHGRQALGAAWAEVVALGLFVRDEQSAPGDTWWRLTKDRDLLARVLDAARWVACWVCRETGMQAVREGEAWLVRCTNTACPSNHVVETEAPKPASSDAAPKPASLPLAHLVAMVDTARREWGDRTAFTREQLMRKFRRDWSDADFERLVQARVFITDVGAQAGVRWYRLTPDGTAIERGLAAASQPPASPTSAGVMAAGDAAARGPLPTGGSGISRPSVTGAAALALVPQALTGGRYFIDIAHIDDRSKITSIQVFAIRWRGETAEVMNGSGVWRELDERTVLTLS